MKFQSKVIPKTLNPTFNQEFVLTISSTQLNEHLVISIWDKDLLRSDFLGYMEVPVVDLIHDLTEFEDANNHPQWFPLSARNAKEKVAGDICVQFGLVGYLEPSLRQIADSVHVVHHAALISTEDPAEDLYFNHSLDVSAMEEQDIGDSMENITLDTLSDAGPMEHSEMAGILLMQIVGANDLPYEKNTLKTTFNCDPFAVVSYGKTAFRTKVIRHSLNPSWNQVIHFHLKQNDIANNWPVKWCIYDFERFTKNNTICEADIPLSTLLGVCEKPVKHPHRPTPFNPVEYDIPLDVKNQRNIVEGSTPVLSIRVSYIPYTEIRRNFWLALLNLYGSNCPQELDPKIDRVSFETMLDSIESNYSEETINNMFALIKKTPTDEMTFSEAVEVLERKIKANAVFPVGTVHPIGIETERLMMMKRCPICQKRLNHRGDFDVVSHFALCSHGNSELLDQLAMGGFTTQESASSKWYTKIFSFVTFGGLGIGKNSGHILYQDRATGQLVKEKMPTYIRLGIRLLYQVAGSKSTVESRAIKKLLRNMTLKQGSKFDSPKSKSNIPQFAAFHNLDMEEGKVV
jgi:phosphatidylserine decarboxylase